MNRWREQSLGAAAPWTPTLLRVQEQTVEAFTGTGMVLPLVRRLGPRSTMRVLRALGSLRLNRAGGEADGAVDVGGMGRKRFLRLGAGLVVAAGVTLAGRTPALAGERRAGSSRQVDFYSCAGKPDGNYIHPTDCTKFISCVAQQYAYERDCAACHPNPDNCPNGKLHYDAASDACLWSYEAGCVTEQSKQ
ncbi:chitin binding peritrophin-A domain-containing protein [Streptomyces sp. NPDC090056]|uniref:chitin binding peritrophin-A domain-containing protein n=1 Tax=Streptomyces sp. NPDC090056 TaxID=3365934 RepID=UPI00380D728A